MPPLFLWYSLCMSTYLELQNRVLTRLIDVPTAVTAEVPTLVNNALSELQTRHNFLIMRETFETGTTIATRALVDAVPADWKTWRKRPYVKERYGSISWLKVAENIEDAEGYYGHDNTIDLGSPKAIGIDDPAEDGSSTFLIYPYPDGNALWGDGEYDIIIPYWKYVTPLSANGDENWFTNNVHCEWFIVNYAVAEGFRLNWDFQKAEAYDVLAEAAYQKARVLDKMKVLGGMTTLVPHMGAEEPAFKE